jgi:RimJ/RimL family protein N-acetyltransferase
LNTISKNIFKTKNNGADEKSALFLLMDANFQLSDGIILLRRASITDIPQIVEAVHESLPELHPWLDWATEDYDEAAARRWLDHVELAWDHSSSFHFVIIDCASGQFTGICTLDGIDDQARRCNLGYWVRTNRAGQGMASYAVRLAARFAFQTLGLASAEIIIAARNIASQRAAQKAGAQYQGSLSKPVVVRLDAYEAVLYLLNPAHLGLAT